MIATEEELTAIANSLCDKYGYEHVVVRYNPRLWGRIGRCNPVKLRIEVSTRWVLANNKWFLVRLMKHEIAHLKVSSNGKEFSKECNRMGIHGGPHIQGPYRYPPS